jgi:hypothetical protein
MSLRLQVMRGTRALNPACDGRKELTDGQNPCSDQREHAATPPRGL